MAEGICAKSSPKRIYTYDAQGHRKTEQGLYDDSDSVDAGMRRANPANPGRRIWKVGSNAEDESVRCLPRKPIPSAPQLGTMSVGKGDSSAELGVMVAAGSNVGYTNVTVDAADGNSCTLPDDYTLESHTFASKTGSGMSRRLTAQKP